MKGRVFSFIKTTGAYLGTYLVGAIMGPLVLFVISCVVLAIVIAWENIF